MVKIQNLLKVQMRKKKKLTKNKKRRKDLINWAHKLKVSFHPMKQCKSNVIKVQKEKKKKQKEKKKKQKEKKRNIQTK